VTVSSSVGGWTGQRFAHEAFVFDRDDEVRRRVVPFVEEGLAEGQAVIVVAAEPVREVLADHLGAVVDELAVFADSAAFWQGTGQATLAAYHESMRPLLEDGRPWRLVGEPTWLTVPGGEAWSRFEAVANDAFAEYPYYSLCLHDRRRVGRQLIENQLRAHPLVWDGTEVVPSPDYEPTERFLRSVEPAWTPAPANREGTVVTDCVTARRWVREVDARDRAVRETGGSDTAARDTGDRVDDVLLAVHELVANAVTAAGTAQLSTWAVNGSRVWEVADAGPGLHDVSAGYAPPPLDVVGGRGLWLARSLADELQVRPHGPGTAVRLVFSRT
jgi:anti-sigma regulatory factor (Ser/Thr protein kinase)